MICNLTQEVQENKVPKPYSPRSKYSHVAQKESNIWGTQEVPVAVPSCSKFGKVSSQPQQEVPHLNTIKELQGQ